MLARAQAHTSIPIIIRIDYTIIVAKATCNRGMARICEGEFPERSSVHCACVKRGLRLFKPFAHAHTRRGHSPNSGVKKLHDYNAAAV